MDRTITEVLSRLTEPIRRWGGGVVSGYVRPTMQKVSEAITPKPQEILSPLQEEKPMTLEEAARQMIEQGGWREAGQPTPTPTAMPSPAMMPQAQAGYSQLPGFMPQAPEQGILDLILSSAQQYGIHPSLLAALLFQESGFNPTQVNPYSPDYGMAQINLPMHPGTTQEQAFNPGFAVPWAAQKLSGDIGYFGGDIGRGLAAYNVGRGGAGVAGQYPFGGGPLGQTYIDNVARNLAMELIKELGLTTTL